MLPQRPRQILQRILHLTWQHGAHLVVITFLLFHPELYHLVQKIRQLHLLNVLLHEFRDGKLALEQEAEHEDEALQLILSTGRIHIDHTVGGKKHVALKNFKFLLLLESTIFVVDWLHRSKVDQCVTLGILMLTNVLQLQIIVNVSKLVQQLQLARDLYSDLG